jgi:hypothetical protein
MNQQPVGSQMLRKLGDEVRACYAHADDCAHRAQGAHNDGMREGFLRLQKSWLTLARSYEFAEQLLDFPKENTRNRRRTLQ